jgi:hypothetical protein
MSDIFDQPNLIERIMEVLGCDRSYAEGTIAYNKWLRDTPEGRAHNLAIQRRVLADFQKWSADKPHLDLVKGRVQELIEAGMDRDRAYETACTEVGVR